MYEDSMWWRMVEMLCRQPEWRGKTTKSFKSNTEFKFGDGKIVTSEKCVSIPCKIAGERVNVVIDLVKSEIPLLLSKEVMKKAGTKADFV